jgi:hypothetical protein
MRTILSLLPLVAAANAAFAHSSVLPHDHPHGLLPNLDAVLILALLAAFAFVVFRQFRGGR